MSYKLTVDASTTKKEILTINFETENEDNLPVGEFEGFRVRYSDENNSRTSVGRFFKFSENLNRQANSNGGASYSIDVPVEAGKYN